MKTKPNAAQAGEHTPANEKAPGVAIARGREKTTFKLPNSKSVAVQTQGKRPTVAFAADLTLHPPQRLREVFPNSRAHLALSVAEASGHQYVIAAGHLMTSDAGAIAMILGSDADTDAVVTSVLAAHARMREFSDVTAWSVMLSAEMYGAVSRALEATQS